MPLKLKCPKILSRLRSAFSKGRNGHNPPTGFAQTSILHGAHHFRMRDMINVVNDGRGRLDALPKHPDMSGKQAEYIPDSRQPEVEELCEQESSGTELVLCIHGPAGIGKSTLATHLSGEFRSSGRLAASIFLGAFPTDSSGPVTIIKMIAHKIGSMHPRAIPKIAKAMDRCHGTSLETHLQQFILEPLQSLNHPEPFIIIIDAMDEWKDAPTFLKALASLNPYSHVVKFIITDRLNPCVFHVKDAENVSIYTYPLGPISKEVIKAYFYKHLATVPWVDGRMAHPPDVEKLTELSGGLPIWASTVIKLLSHQFDDSPPHEILEEIIGSRRQVGGGDELGELYRNALSRLFPSLEAKRQFRRFMGATVALQEPLSQSDFSMLTGIPLHLIKQIQLALSAVQTRSPPPGSEKMVHPATMLVHLSFIEYVQASTTESSLAISTFDSHSTLGLSCLEQLVRLPPSLSSVSHLRDHQRYAVKYWLLHVSKGTPRASDHQWSQTKHCSTLLQLTAETQRRWASLFLQGFELGVVDSTMDTIGTENGMASILTGLSDSLLEGGEDHWEFQVACLEVAVRIDDGDAMAWESLGLCYDTTGVRTGNLQMYEEAVTAFRHALRLQTELHPDRAELLGRVASALQSCYERNGNMDLLSEAASLKREALDLCPAPHPDRPMLLNNLANALDHLYTYNGGIGTLSEEISLHREALGLRPARHPDRSSSLNNLAGALQSLYEHDGDIPTLEESISLHREALGLRPAPHPDRSNSLSNLANALQSLYECDGNVKALKEAVSLHREALGLCRAPHPNRSYSLSNLANALQSLYECEGNMKVLKEAVSLHREALSLRPAPHPDRSISLNNLAIALQSLYECEGNVKPLEEAVSLHREALSLRPVPHPGRSRSLNNLADALQSLYECEGNVKPLNEAVSMHREALSLCPVPHPDRPQSLQHLADALLSQFEQSGGVDVLDEAISLRCELLVLRPPGHRYRWGAVYSLWQILVKRREVTGDDRDCQEVDSLRAELDAFYD